VEKSNLRLALTLVTVAAAFFLGFIIKMAWLAPH
jgi:hypothetical protein